MSLIGVVLTLVVVGVLLWLLNNYIPMDGKIKRILNAAKHPHPLTRRSGRSESSPRPNLSADSSLAAGADQYLDSTVTLRAELR